MAHKGITMSATSPRITARVDIETQHLLSEAAALSGMPSINSFVLNAAVEKAKDVIHKEKILKLSLKDAHMLVDALDQPAKVHAKLKAASDRHRSKTQ